MMPCFFLWGLCDVNIYIYTYHCQSSYKKQASLDQPKPDINHEILVNDGILKIMQSYILRMTWVGCLSLYNETTNYGFLLVTAIE